MSLMEHAACAASLFAVDPIGLGGVCLRSPAQPARDRWLRLLRESLPEETPWRRIPSNIPADRLLGDLDMAATLKAARPLAERGALAAADGGLVVIAMAERMSAHTASLLNGVIDSGQVLVPRSGVMIEHPARIGIVALDESEAEEDSMPPALMDRLAIVLDLHDIDPRSAVRGVHERESIAAARRLLPFVRATPEMMETLCGTCAALGVTSPRIAWLALRAARVSAALDERTDVAGDDAALAAQLVIAPRAAQLPSEEMPRDEPSAQPPKDQSRANAGASGPDTPPRDAVDARVLAAARAAIPKGLLVRLESAHASRSRSPVAGRAGALRAAGRRGRPAGSRAASGRGRLHLVETLRAAAPWQKLRGGGSGERVRIASQDLREQRFKVRSPTLTIFAVDASGSSALNRLAEAKGAVEMMLAECYIRRDTVAVIAFRNSSAELVLPPTRSLVRAKRCLAGLPGGGGTPLAAALASVATLARQSRRRGETPTLVILTDGRANVGRSGAAGRAAAHADALAAARALLPCACDALLIDSSPKPNPLAREIADAMQARYLALPHPGAADLSGVVREAARAGIGR